VSDAGRWAHVTAVFQEALERDETARGAYLDAACAGDGPLRAEVESLLAAHQAAGRFAEGSPLEALAPSASRRWASTRGFRPAAGLAHTRSPRCWARAGWARCIAHAMRRSTARWP
jgi:hypothetical protein